MRYEVAVSISPAINWTNGHIGIAIFSLQHKEAIVIALVCIINEDWLVRALAAARAPHIFPNKCIFLIVRHCYEICLNLDFLSFCPEIIASIIQLTV